ncbi:MAG: hypothetical protein ACK4OF_03600 [Aquificaceae bacterium]
MPKFLILDKLLLREGIYLVAERVEEGLTNIRLKGVQIYSDKSRLVSFDTLKVSLGFLRLRIVGLCEGKPFLVDISPRERLIEARDFTCLEGFQGLSASISMKDGLYGNMLLKGSPLEELDLTFKGRVFTARAKAMGFHLVGDGQIVYNPQNPLRSAINGQVSGMGMKLIIGGTLEKLEVKAGP